MIALIADDLSGATEVAGVADPKSFRGQDVLPMTGRSFRSVILGNAQTVHPKDTSFCWEFHGSRAIRQGDWKLAKDKEGIQVYTRKTEESKFVEFKGVTELEGKVDAFVAVMKDADNMTNWIYSVVNGKILESTDTTLIYYAESKLPWPFDNRDAVYLDSFKWNSKEKILTIAIKCLPDYIGKNEDLVRIPYAKGFWKAEEIYTGKLKVTFQMVVDPGGSIPAWLVNAFVIDSPFETLKGLKEVINDKKYLDVSYDFIY